MVGGSSAAPKALEVGGVNGGGFNSNFALDSLTIDAITGTTGYVGLVDEFANATTSGWTSGSEALYLDSLFGTGTSDATAGVLILNGLNAYLPYDCNVCVATAQAGVWELQPGFFVDPNGKIVDILATPLPASLPLFLSGLGALGLLGWRRKQKAQAAAFS
jgi:hypothetical protein